MAAYALPGIFVMGCLVYLIESYVIRCPEQSEWNIRAEIQCQNITKYFCLYNYIHYTYEEGCTGPEWDIPGSKRVYSRNFNKAPCNDTRYQPINFVTNGSSDCIFRKSLCTEEGQILLTNGTTKTDSTCRCDYKQGYAFATVPRNKCSCRPSEEDCSCYVKKCQGIGYYLSADYECTKNGTKKTVCPLMSENPSEDPHIDMTPTGTLREDDSYAIRGIWIVFIVVLCALIGMIVSTVITMCIMLRQRLPRSRCLSTEQTGNAESKRMDTGPSLDTIEQNGSKHESAGNAESKKMDTGLPLDTIGKNASNHESDGNKLEEIVSGNNEVNQIALRESDENQKSALINNIRKEGVVTSFKRFNEILDIWKNGVVKLAVTGKSGIASRAENWKSALDNLKVNIDKEGPETALKQFFEDQSNWKNEPVKLAVTGKSGIASSDENWKFALGKLKDYIDKEGLETALKPFSKDLDNWKNELVKLAVTGKSGIASRAENWKSALDNLKVNIDKEGPETALKQFFEDQINWKNEPVKLAVTGKSGIASSDEKWKFALGKLKDYIDKKGLETTLKQFSEDLDNWKNEPVKLAVTGKSGVGKSSFINAIRNLKSGDPDFATSSGSGNTTTKPTIYEYPGNPNITLHDLPGFGTIELPTNEYEKRMELHKYGYILIFVGNIEENDIEIAKTLNEMKKPFCFVRSKIDIDILNAEKDGESEIEIVEKIMSKFSGNLKHAGFNKAKFFVISNHNRRICQFNNLVSYIESNLPGLTYDAFMFSILGELLGDEIESKYQILNDRLLKVLVASSSLYIAPFSFVNVMVDMALLCKELLLYHKTFGFEQQCVKDILKDDHIRQKLNASSIVEIQPDDEAIRTFVQKELRKLATSEARKSSNDLIVPCIESVVSVWPTGGDTFRLLIQVLDGCRNDAKLVYSHQMSVDV